tara:strand:- start:1018 stop:1374 length:357 start_codon:yes stop_codon:yes gene_type:complete
MNDFYFSKAALPRQARQAPDLREGLRSYVTERLLKVSDVCLMHDEDPYRKEFGFLHRRYANMLLMVTEAIQDVDYLTKSIVTWVQEDFASATSGAQRDAAGLCGAELIKILEIYNETK